MHHYLLGWFAASCGQFNHPASGALLALGAGVLAQGAGAYGMDAFFSLNRGCTTVAVEALALGQVASSLGCSFQADLIPGWDTPQAGPGVGMAFLQACGGV